jgi:hypothetical protein
MKRVVFLLLLAGCFVPLASAQENEHLQIGVFADYFRLSQTENNFGGVGARLGFMAYKLFKFEAQMSYDFTQNFTEGFNNGTGIVAIQRTNVRILHGEAGPKIDLGHGRIRPFVTVKGGGIDFNVSNRPATIGTAFSQISNIRASNVNGVLYPGGGLEGHLGPLGLRFDIGDEIYFNNGAHHNLSLAFGPYIRF